MKRVEKVGKKLPIYFQPDVIATAFKIKSLRHSMPCYSKTCTAILSLLTFVEPVHSLHGHLGQVLFPNYDVVERSQRQLTRA